MWALGPQPNGPMAPTGPPGLACNSWGQLGAPLVAQAWLWGCPTPPPCSQIQWAPQLVAPNGLATLMAMAQGCAHGLCTSHERHSVPLGTWVLLEMVMFMIINRDNFDVFWSITWVVWLVLCTPSGHCHHTTSHLTIIYSTALAPAPPPVPAPPPSMRSAAAPE